MSATDFGTKLAIQALGLLSLHKQGCITMDNTKEDTSNFLNWVEIKNFKSIKDLRLDCKRVNIFIGRPNVGKSNILEGLGMLGPVFGYGQHRYLSNLFRYNELVEAFRDNDTQQPIQIKSDKTVSILRSFSVIDFPFAFISGKTQWFNSNRQLILENTNHLYGGGKWIDGIKNIETSSYYPIYFPLKKQGDNDTVQFQLSKTFFDGFTDQFMVRKYDYKYLPEYTDIGIEYLLPPNGANLFSVIDRNRELRQEIGKLFEKDKLDFVLSKKDRKFYLQRKEDDYVYLYPYSNVADTFQRFVFYIAAVESNKNSVIIFEEPEVHSFPPYTKALAHRIVYSEQNQFFISTHSPYLLQTLIGELDDSELAVYITYYKDYQTHVRLLTADELQEAQDLGIDLFYNLSRYEPNA